jgi:hypothetical protein
MRFPEHTRDGSEAHSGALRRLDEAHSQQRKATDDHEASRQTPGERAAASNLAAADEQVAAREAWVSWVERGW